MNLFLLKIRAPKALISLHRLDNLTCTLDFYLFQSAYPMFNIGFLIPSDFKVFVSIKYEFIVMHEVIKKMETDGTLPVQWAYNDGKFKGGQKYNLRRESVKVLQKRLSSSAIGKHVLSFTKAVITSTTGLCASMVSGRKWSEWVLVHFDERSKHEDIIKCH